MTHKLLIIDSESGEVLETIEYESTDDLLESMDNTFSTREVSVKSINLDADNIMKIEFHPDDSCGTLDNLITNGTSMILKAIVAMQHKYAV